MTSGPTRVPCVLTPAPPSETPPEVLGDPHLQCWNELQPKIICSKDPESQTNRAEVSVSPVGGGGAAGGDFPGGLVAKNLPSNARETGLIPGWETKRPHATGQLSPCAETEDPACCN